MYIQSYSASKLLLRHVLFCFYTDVSVSIPAVLIFSEGDEEVDVCATLSAKQNIERSVTITIATSIINAE